MQAHELRALRLSSLACSVLYDVDLRPTEDGIVLTGPLPIVVSWAQCRQALDGVEPESDEGYSRLARWLIARQLISQLRPDELVTRVRPVGLPRGHALHPGAGWAGDEILGDALDLGLGVMGAGAQDVTVVPPQMWEAAGIDPTPVWPRARSYLAAMCLLAVQRRAKAPREVLRPMGDCDVVTLLAAREYRKTLTSPDGGMTAVAVPMRRRGWTDLRAIDPAFAVTAASLTAPEERGFAGPLLVTADEVVMVERRPAPTYR